MIRISRRDLAACAFLVLAGLATQAVWMRAVPFAWGWDAFPNLAIGRMYFGLPQEMWDIKHYYAPAYGIFLTLMGVHHFETISALKVGTLFVGGLMPVFLFLMLRPFDFAAALLAASVFVGSFGHALFSTDMMNHHFHSFQLLFMSMLFAWYLYRASAPLAVLIGVAAAFANAGRQVTAFIFLAGVAIVVLAHWLERRNVRVAATAAAILIGSYFVTTLALSLARQAALGGPFMYGVTYDVGARTMLVSNYFGPSIYQKEFHPGEDYVFMRPENGPASKQLFEHAQARIEKTRQIAFRGAKPGETIADIIAEPTQAYGYALWLGVSDAMSLLEGDRLLRKVLIETVTAQPRIVRYYLWNFWTYLFGPPILPNVECEQCRCPPCFAANLPAHFVGGFMGANYFHTVAAPRVIAQMDREHQRAIANAKYGSFLFADVRLLFVAKPVLTILLFASIILARGRMRFLMLYCAAAVVMIGATTALAWPVQARYQYPAIPYVLAGASVALLEIARRIRRIWHARAAPRQA